MTLRETYFFMIKYWLVIICYLPSKEWLESITKLFRLNMFDIQHTLLCSYVRRIFTVKKIPILAPCLIQASTGQDSVDQFEIHLYRLVRGSEKFPLQHQRYQYM